jgi:hypothetical protein
MVALSGIVALTGLPPVPAFAQCAGPTLELRPAGGSAGRDVTVTGQGFRAGCTDVILEGDVPPSDPPQAGIHLVFIQRGRVTPLTTVDAGPDYAFAVSVVVPKSARSVRPLGFPRHYLFFLVNELGALAADRCHHGDDEGASAWTALGQADPTRFAESGAAAERRPSRLAAMVRAIGRPPRVWWRRRQRTSTPSTQRWLERRLGGVGLPPEKPIRRGGRKVPL